ncbi:MAG: DUF2924 domain-containing protein [Planctomycetota bacterium]|nr:DUF2924 domain-containing protein [Planctomycetota bacterium]
MSTTRSQVDLDLDQLPRMPLARLRALWTEHIGKAAPPMQKRLLIRELAWRVQERVHGGLDIETQRLIKAAMRAAQRGPVTVNAEHPASLHQLADASSCRAEQRGADAPIAATASPRDLAPSTASPHRARPRPQRAQPTTLPSSSRLIRIWGGVSHEVTVLDGGKRYRYRDKEYRSLSEIARVITGTHWSGPRFFGTNAARTAPAASSKPNAAKSQPRQRRLQ